ncbi:type I secretion system permease/ATPase [Marivibrio halodurans]|uniref:Type I secretion system permease/ATPase n=1 Tax=Marivibrio halodurans TaxID=2039722 RepID=A0A8J7S8X4_9PROT|nr:type I secretion system permease/ATPase [Marivibrio halodurans]MBP5857587.1 type I secretion system permease/ATPase [Marivibrio halodurans]
MPSARDAETEEDTSFDFEIPARPRADADPREMLVGGTSEPSAAASGARADREDLDGPGWDTSPFEPETRESAATDSVVTDGGEDATGDGSTTRARPDSLDAPARRAGVTQGRPTEERPRDGDLLDPREAEGAPAREKTPSRDPDAGSGERDLLSERNLKEYLEALGAGAARNETPPEGRGREGERSEMPKAEDRAVDAYGDREDGGGEDGGGEDGSGDEARAEKARRNWHIKPSPGTKDDPLLGSLTILCTLLDRNISAEGLTSGLPLVDGMLTPELFVRAAQRAGVSARLVRRPLDGIGKLALPCVLLLDNQRACVLTHLKRSEGKATIILPEMGAGARDVDYQELAQDYVGYALFARPEFQYDQRAQETRIADPKGWFWGTIFGSWKLYVEVMIAAIMINAFVIANPLFVMNVYDRVVPNFAEETLWVLAIGILIVYAFDFLLKLLRAYLVDVAGKTADTRIASRLFQHMLGMKMANRPPSAGGLANQLREFEHLREFFTSSTMTSLIDLPFIFLFLAIISVIGTWKIVVIPAFIVFITVIVGMLMQIPMQRVVRETHRESQQKNAILIEAISGVETIKATGSEGRMQRAWETFVDKTARSAMLAHRWSSLAMTFSGSMMQMVTVAVVVVGVYEIQEGNMTTGALVACTILSGRALAPLSQIAGIATRFHQSRQALHALDGMMKTPVERPEGRSFVTRPSFNGNIEFKNVSFTYPEAKTQALNDVTFKIEAGEKIGVIGRIGSGKSTLERLILGLYDPDEGSVLVDGTDTRQVDPADLRRAIGVVPQDVYLFWGTVRENIALGAPYADDQTILRAARIAGVDEFISRHPLGLDMPVGERGASLSGGQRQAISVARALLLDPPMLVLDEPTSAMDNTTEARFKARLGTILANKTLILVTHRGSLLSLVDRLIVMDGGRIVADGPKDIVMEALNAGRIQTART